MPQLEKVLQSYKDPVQPKNNKEMKQGRKSRRKRRKRVRKIKAKDWTRSYCIAQETLLNVMWQPGVGPGFGGEWIHVYACLSPFVST